MGRHEGRAKENKGGKVREGGGLERERERKKYIQRCARRSKIKE